MAESVPDRHYTHTRKHLWREFKRTVNKRKKQFNTFSPRPQKSDDSDHITEEEEDDANKLKSVLEEIVEPPVISNDGHYWSGKDYSNHYKSSIKNVPEFWLDQLDRTETPRMPWRDQALVVIGESARDLARHFIQRWNQCKVNIFLFF
ncbi:phospholipase D2 isoform X1 [Brachionus plicatilis]|uniref:Phospholipase D2 isoform X1 n=1 Tax=Brachionus plicatilis TaxID=10195 RepID=A0A3M7S3Q2_BRAPC|nr:phospholipase D2 isoform X1 [Brachionus plicatilis]